MPNLFTAPPGSDIAGLAATFIRTRIAPEALPHAVILVPTRRAAVALREALRQQLAGKASLSPRMVAFAYIDRELALLAGPQAIDLYAQLPAALPPEQHRYLLAAQVQAFERRRLRPVTLEHALALADELMALQDQCTRADVVLDPRTLRQLYHADFARHWEQSLRFLAIISEHWPDLEREMGMVTAAAREVATMRALAELWRESPPACPIIAVGSTASQPSTAEFLKAIAELPHGAVILPGLDPAMPQEEWESIGAGHPLFHIRQFLDRWPVTPIGVAPLAAARRSIWLDALSATADIPYWGERTLPSYAGLRLIPCTHAEEEARVVSLLLREAAEAGTRTALVTPNEGLMARVAAHLRRYGIHIDRLHAGTLAESETGSLWNALLEVLREPERVLPLRALLHHRLMDIDPGLLRALEPGWHGIKRTRPGQLPAAKEAVRVLPGYAAIQQLVRDLYALSRREQTAEQWLEACRAVLAPFVRESGEGHEAIEQELGSFGHAYALGTLDVEDFAALLRAQLAKPRRSGGLQHYPGLVMLTPVEARLQSFERVILADMQDSQWPGLARPNAWINRAAAAALGLPSPEESTSLAAHDILMLGSGSDVVMTYPQRDRGSPSARSRYIERLVTLLAMHGVKESAITAREYIVWARQLDEAPEFAPATRPKPRPSSEQRPRRMSVSKLNDLFTDPYSIYARYVLGLRTLDPIDAELGPSDFGTLAHHALRRLAEHWDTYARPANAEEIAVITDEGIRHFSDRPNVALFWRRRLMGALEFLNGEEIIRRPACRAVKVEHDVSAVLLLSNGESVCLEGRIDRLEERGSGATVIDYKSGKPPSTQKVEEVHDVQLLAYAMVLAQVGDATESLEYWALPKGNEAASIESFGMDALVANGLPEKLRAALAVMLSPETAFLASPHRKPGDRASDYDGISRYDEWAG